MERFKFFTAFVLLLIATSSYAWWEAGHMLVADIAYENLTKEAKKTVNSLMEEMKLENTSTHNYPFDKAHPNYTLMAAAHWPDDIKSFPNYLGLFNTFHYIEHAYSDDETDFPNVIPRDNVVSAINHFKRHLAVEKANKYSRARALAFLVHFVGDIHQPLHCAEYYSKTLPKGDRGGNSFKISFKEKNGDLIKNLHSLWDSALLLFPNKGFNHNVSAPKDIHTIMKSITQDYPKSYFSDKLKITDADKWHAESHLIAIDAHQLEFNSTPNDAYLSLNSQLAEQRIVLAGYRLANILNQILK